jgi:ppGpp synthetase/RelA/SpoT-type nucleotidyltranferase
MTVRNREQSFLEKSYLLLRPTLELAEKRLKLIITDTASQITDKNLVRFHIRDPRIKSLQSISRKAKLNNYSQDETLKNIFDLVGIRIVCNNTEDVTRFYELLKQSLIKEDLIREENFISDPQSSGYRAKHINFYVEVGEIFSPERVACEVQIRTLLQDSWAELTHDDVYKNDIELPEDLKGRMADLALILSAADEIAQKVRRRIERKYSVSGEIKLDMVTSDGLAFVFKHVFGKEPSEYFINKAERFSQKNGLKTLHEVDTILSKAGFRDIIREAYIKESGFPYPPMEEEIFMASVKAASQDEKTAVSYIKTVARKERDEIETSWRNDVINKLPDTYDDFLEQAPDEDEGLNVEEFAEALGEAKSCAICGTTIVDMDSLSYVIADHYNQDNVSEIFDTLYRIDASWADGEFCSYHAYYIEKDK